MSARAWYIQKDKIGTDQEKILRHTFGPDHGFTSKNLPERLPYRFKLFDDDGNLYYQGRASDERAIEDAFAWGQSFAGVASVTISPPGNRGFVPFIG